jgi:hypothetical protein
MTERTARRRRPPAAPVVWGSIALFAVLFAMLAYQLSSQAAGAAERRQVIARKVIAKRVVKTIVPAEDDEVEGAPATESVPTESEPEYVVPEPEYVAPEPAPVVTSSS